MINWNKGRAVEFLLESLGNFLLSLFGCTSFLDFVLLTRYTDFTLHWGNVNVLQH